MPHEAGTAESGSGDAWLAAEVDLSLSLPVHKNTFFYYHLSPFYSCDPKEEMCKYLNGDGRI